MMVKDYWNHKRIFRCSFHCDCACVHITSAMLDSVQMFFFLDFLNTTNACDMSSSLMQGKVINRNYSF